MALSRVTGNRLNQDLTYDSIYLLASLGTNPRTTRICGEEGPSLREKREGWGPLAGRVFLYVLQYFHEWAHR
jgi:hypothetical protein